MVKTGGCERVRFRDISGLEQRSNDIELRLSTFKVGELTAFNENSFVDGTTVGIRRLLAEKETTRVESVHNTEQQHCDKISVVAHRDFLVVVNFDFDEIAVVVEPDCVFGLSTSSPLYH